MKPAHVRTWSGGPSATITDMTNAGRRGARCAQVRVWNAYGENEEAAGAALLRYLGAPETLALDYDAILAGVQSIRDQYPGALHYEAHAIRGVDAPKEPLSAGVAQVWSARADEDGLHLADLTDHNNDPRMITPHGQSDGEAYRRAAKVWPQVAAAKTLHAARDILEAAGCRLHYYCAMD